MKNVADTKTTRELYLEQMVRDIANAKTVFDTKRMAEIKLAEIEGREPEAWATATGEVVEKERDRLIVVCSYCLRSSCWQGVLFCEAYKTAGTIEKTVSELIELRLEHESHWKDG